MGITPLSGPALTRVDPLPQQPQRIPATAGKVLVVDDDEILSRFLGRLLVAHGFTVNTALDGISALDLLRSAPDLLVLDLNLPKMDGISVLQSVRAMNQQLPVLVLTARARSESAVLALESGADDCLTKPFSSLELLARVRALLRRHTPAVPQSSQCGSLTLDRNELRVARDGRRVELTPREYDLLEFLMRTPRVPVSRSVLLKEVWGAEYDGSSNVVDVYMKYLRDKVDVPGLPKLIRTVRGLGYVISED